MAWDVEGRLGGGRSLSFSQIKFHVAPDQIASVASRSSSLLWLCAIYLVICVPRQRILWCF